MAIFILNSKHKSWENTPSQESPTSVNIFELIGDTASDLPTDPYYFSSPAGRYKMAQGSLAWIISTSNFYMYNSQNQWVMQVASGGGGGGGGTDDYTQLLNLPQINSVTLTGNLTAADLSLQSIIDSGHKLDPALIAYDTSHIAVSSTDKSTWDAKSDLTIGTTGTTAAAGNHTHVLSIASDSGTSDLNLSADTKYKITAGGSTYVIKTPADNNTTYSLASGTGADANKIILTPSSGSAQKITVPYATTAGSASSADAVAWTNVSSKPTTIAGYGITDAKIASGVITLGANTITPLTSHQSVTDNNPTLAWGTKSKVGTVGSTDLNVTMPAKPTYTASDVGLGNVTNDKQVKGLASGTTQNNLVKFGADGYTVADAGVAVENQAAGISNVDTKIPTSKSVKQNVAKTSVLDGYAIKSTGSAIATTDTINDAFGKVEKRVQVNENNISLQQDTVAQGGNGYAIINGIRLYVSSTTPTGSIPQGSTWINGNIIKAYGRTDNLFDMDSPNITDNTYINTSGQIISDNSYELSDYIPVSASTAYTWRFNLDSGSGHTASSVGLYNGDKELISGVSHAASARYFSFTTDANTAYVRCSVYKATADEAMLNLGNSPLPYVPYLDWQ